jgi:hypothetical protein
MGPVFLRALVLAVLALPMYAGAREWRFDVTGDGFPIGTYHFTLQENGTARQLTAEARFRVRLVLVEAYRYEHHADEHWQGDCLVRLDTRTVEQGKTTLVSGRDEGEGFVIEGPRGRESLARCPMTFAYWNPRILTAKALINAQTGAVTPITVKSLGAERIKARGALVDARRFRIETEKTVTDVWYSSTDEWLGLRSTTRAGGHVLDYTLK